MIKVEYPWLPPKSNLRLSSNEVHVWRAALDQPFTHVQELSQILSDDERRRAKRFHFERDRKRFIVSHGILRSIIGRYLSIEPSQLQFCYGLQGKPYLTEIFTDSNLRFNLAHSGELALYAFTRGREIGIDLERVRTDLACEQIAVQFFSRREITMLMAVPESLRQKAFFDGWTRKEAFIKAIGEGLSLPLDSFDVSLSPGESPALLQVRVDSREALHWSLRDLNLGHDYIASLAVEGHDWQLTLWDWSK